MEGETGLRILSVFFHPDPSVSAVGGAEKRVLESLKVFWKKGVGVTVVEPKPSLVGQLGTGYAAFELPVVSMSGRGGWLGIYVEWALWTLKASIECLRLVSSREHHLVHAPNNTLPNLVPTYLAHLASRLPLCTVVHHIDSLSPEANQNFFAVYSMYRRIGYGRIVSLIKASAFLLVLGVLKRSDACITVSGATAKALVRNGVPAGKVHVSGNGVNTDYINRFKFEGEKLYDGVFVGRLTREKGVFDLVAAWQKIVRAKGGARLLIIGSGPDTRELKRVVRELGLEGSVFVSGRRGDEEMYRLMKASKVFVFPSMFEGWGLAVGEALACGLPVVCYDIPALREVFGDCESVFLVPARDIEKLKSTLLRVLEMKEAGRLAETSKAYARHFGWETVAVKDLQVIKGLRASRAR